MNYLKIDVSMLSDEAKKHLFDVLEKRVFLLDESRCGWRVGSFHFLPETEMSIDELRKDLFIHECCPISPYFHP